MQADTTLTGPRKPQGSPRGVPAYMTLERPAHGDGIEPEQSWLDLAKLGLEYLVIGAGALALAGAVVFGVVQVAPFLPGGAA